MTVIEFAKPRLSQQIGRYRFDPLGFVEFAFPWGRPGTALAGEPGPEPWQREDDMRKRGLASPDDGDALALTFAYPAYRANREEERRSEEKLAILKRRIL